MAKRATVYDVAELANVSPATVSRVINNFSAIKSDTRTLVLDAIRQLNYMPSEKKNSRLNRRLIGLMIGDIRNPFFSDMTYYLQHEFLQHGYAVVPLSVEFDSEREKNILETAKNMNPAGLILVSSMDSENLAIALSELDCPVTLTDRVIEGFAGNVVIQDNFQAGYIAAKHLIDLGHNEIAFMAGNTNSASSMRRVDGYRKALANAFLPVDERLIFYGNMGVQRGYTDGLAYIERLGNLPRAVLIANDMTAIGFLDACKERGVSVPEDISIVSFDGIGLASLKSINLTTVKQPIEEMARKMCEFTIKAINEPRNAHNNRIMLEPTLITGGTACENLHKK